MNDFTVLVDAARHADGTIGDVVSAVHVRWDPRPPVPSPAAAARLEERWSHYLADAQARGASLFNGPITRLIDAQRRPDGVVELLLGPADYKTFLVVHLRDRAWFKENAPELSAAALGNSVLLTSGDKALLGIRSPQVSAYAGRAHLVGGVLDLLAADPAPTVEDLVGHLLTELAEEAGVTLADLQPQGQWPRLLDIARDEFLTQPEAIWQWEVRTPLVEIAARLVPQEHSGAIEVPRTNLPPQFWTQMTPVARHTWELWSASGRR